ncbi:MAG: EamA family transporter [Acidobacteria bacterium]|nr:EamA family transporter [Acidobacteriota bacterium]
MDHENKEISPVWYVFIAVLLWSTGGLFIKLTTLDAAQVTFFRSSLAALTVALLTYKKGLRINLFGVFASIIYATLLFLFVWATKKTTAANAIFLQYTAPIYILVLAPFILREKFHLRDLVTVLLCIGGMSLFFVGQLRIDDYQGNLAALGSGVFLGLYIMLLKHPQARRMNSTITVIYGNFLLAAINLPSVVNFKALVGSAPGVAIFPALTWTDIFAVGFLGIFQIGISYILFIKGVTGGTRPLDASIIGFIEPLLNPVWVFLFIGERPSNWALLGGAIIIATVAGHTLLNSGIKSKPPAAAGG